MEEKRKKDKRKRGKKGRKKRRKIQITGKIKNRKQKKRS